MFKKKTDDHAAYAYSLLLIKKHDRLASEKGLNLLRTQPMPLMISVCLRFNPYQCPMRPHLYFFLTVSRVNKKLMDPKPRLKKDNG